MVHRDWVAQVEAVIGIAAKIEASVMAGHNELTRGALRLLVNAPGVIGVFGDVVVLKQVADDLARNLPLHRREIPKHRDPPPPRKTRSTCLSALGTQVTNGSTSGGGRLGSIQTKYRRSIRVYRLPLFKKFL